MLKIFGANSLILSAFSGSNFGKFTRKYFKEITNIRTMYAISNIHVTAAAAGLVSSSSGRFFI